MKQSKSQVLGRAGQRWFEAQIPKEWVFQRPTEDFGIDGVVLIGEEGPLNGIEFKVQIKASDRWERQESQLVLSGVKRRTVRDWIVGLVPTVLALYEQSTCTGYLAWVVDLFPSTEHIKDLFSGTTDRITIKIPTTLPIDQQCWAIVRQRLQKNYEGLIDAFTTTRVNVELLPLLHTLSESLRGLYFSQQNWPAADNSEKQNLLLLLEALSHRDAYKAICHFQSTVPNDIILARQIELLLQFYREKLDRFYHGHEALLGPETEVATAFRVNVQALLQERSPMIVMVIGLLSKFADMLRRPNDPAGHPASHFSEIPWASLFRHSEPD